MIAVVLGLHFVFAASLVMVLLHIVHAQDTLSPGRIALLFAGALFWEICAAAMLFRHWRKTERPTINRLAIEMDHGQHQERLQHLHTDHEIPAGPYEEMVRQHEAEQARKRRERVLV